MMLLFEWEYAGRSLFKRRLIDGTTSKRFEELMRRFDQSGNPQYRRLTYDEAQEQWELDII